MGLFSKQDEGTGEAYVEPMQSISHALAAPDKPKRHVKRKYVEVVEFEGTGEIPMQRGKRIVEAKIVIDRVNESKIRGQEMTPGYKTVVIFECVEFEYDD